MPFTFKQCFTEDGQVIKGLLEIFPRIFEDERGNFSETYVKRDFNAAGLEMDFVQDNQSCSVRGVLRGLHYQKNHPQGKLARVIMGEVFDVALDLRPNSASYGKWYSVILSGKKQNQFYLPPGFAHGFLVLSETCIFTYKCTDFYYPDDEGGVIWNDPTVNIAWPDLGINYIVSKKDGNLPRFYHCLPIKEIK